LPKVPFATKTLPKDFSAWLEKGEPYLPIKSVFAATFIWQRGKVIWQSALVTRLTQFSVVVSCFLSECEE